MYLALSRVAALALITTVTAGLSVRVAAQDKKDDSAPFVRVPQLILTHAGAHAPVNAVAFAPDAGTLYVAGFDKQVRRYKLAKGEYVADGVIRVPIGPGNGGVINALAVSPDGKWVAAAGRAPMRSEGWGTADDGIYLEARRFLPQVQADAGVIYLFDPAKPDGGKVIRGPRLGVRSLAFASPSPASGPVVVATSLEYDDAGKRVGAVRVFDVTTGAETANRFDLPGVEVFPAGVAAWATGAKRDGLRVAVAWDRYGVPTDAAGNPLRDKDGNPRPEGLLPSKLLVWDNPKPNGGGTSNWDATERQVIAPLAVRGKGDAATELLHGGYDPKTGTGLHARAADGTTRSEKLTDAGNAPTTPFGIAALSVPGSGDADALLIRNGRDANGLKFELRLRTPKGTQSAAVAGCPKTPVLTASPDGRFIAVAGFADNRVEIHDAVALAAGNPKVQKLAGGARGFDNVKFLEGEKVWVGRADETPAKGGVILDLGVNARAAEPAKGGLKVDAPPAGAAPKIVPPDAANKAWRVTVAVGGADKTVTIPEGRPTAAALLPAKPAWDADLGAVLAVASFQDLDQVAQVTLYDPTDGKELFRFGGPTLPVRALAFSGSRALLAAAGDDGTVPVWSLKGLTRRYPAIDGLAIGAVKGDVTVTKVREKTAADGVFKVDDVIVSVADAKGVQVPVKTPLDFTNTVRGLTIGNQADVQLKRGAVKVAVGARVGFRQPLFTLWVDPAAKDGKHEWVGWAATGRYDASGKGGEDRIGWVSATGDPARPVAFAGANQYRKLFYTRDFIRLLVKHADYDAADRERPKPPEPTLVPTVPVGTPLGNRIVVRQKLTDVTFQLQQLDTTLDLDRAKLEWRVSGPTTTSAWTTGQFTGGSAKLDVSKHDWVRGEHRVTARLLETNPDGDGDRRVGGEATAVVLYVPPAPALRVTIDGKAVASGDVVETMAGEVEIGATAKANDDPSGAAVAVGAGDEKPAALPRAADGTFSARKVALAKGETLVRVTAINAGTGATADEEDAVQVRVRRLEPKVVPKPLVGLEVEPGYDHRATATDPYVFSTPKARLTATAAGRAGNPLTQFEWKDGKGEWQALKADAKSAALAVELPADGTDKEVQVRAKSKDSEFATASVRLRYEGLPEVGLNPPPAEVAAPELLLSGALKAPGPRLFGVRVLVTSVKTGQTRAFDAQFDGNRTAWQTGVTLFPGENQFAYAVFFGARRVHQSEQLTAVKYLRAPVTVGGGVIDVEAGTSGDAALAVAAPPDAAFRELLVNGSALRFRAAAPVRVFGAALWAVGANGATVNSGADRPKPVPAEVRTDDGASAPVPLAVRVAPPKPIVIDPPVIRLSYQGKSFSPEQGLPPVGDPRFGFSVTVTSSAPLARFEVGFGSGPNDALVPVGKLTAADAKAVANGFELNAAPAVTLRRGPANYVRVVAVNAGGSTTVGFGVSYTPAPPRVVVDAIREPKGEALPVPRDGAPVTVNKWLVEAEGRVLWDDDSDPIARDRNLTVVFVANGVAHVPVAVAMPDPAGGTRERRFKGKVFLNTLDPDPKARGETKVRVELRCGESPRAQETAGRDGPEPATFVVRSRDPLREQRLHVVVIGVQVRKEEEPELIKRVIKAVGGEARSDLPLDRGGAFVRRDFAEAILYRPEFQHARQDQLTKIMLRVGEDIKKLTNERGWMNDVVVVYYHGRDWVDPNSGRWLLDSAVTLDSPANRKRADDAIRLSDLPLTHGMPVAVLNVAGTTAPTDDLGIDLAYMRVAWAKAAERGRLLDQFAEALAQQRRTFGGVAKYVDGGGGKTIASLPAEGAGGRVVGLSDNP